MCDLMCFSFGDSSVINVIFEKLIIYIWSGNQFSHRIRNSQSNEKGFTLSAAEMQE